MVTTKGQQYFTELMARSRSMEGAMGAIAFAVLEMFRRGGMSETEVEALHEKMKHHFMKPDNDECNAICRLLEARLQMDKENSGLWYHSPRHPELSV